MPKIYPQGANIYIDLNKEGILDYYPSHSTFIRPMPNEIILIQNKDLAEQPSYHYSEIQDVDGNPFASYKDTVDYLAEFISSFKKGGGSVYLGASKYEEVLFDFRALLEDVWHEILLPEKYWNKIILVKIYNSTGNNATAGIRRVGSVLQNQIRLDLDSSDNNIVAVSKTGIVEVFTTHDNRTVYSIRGIL